MSSSLRVALLSYRADPYSGGQGVYVRNLSRALARLGHRVEVFAGPPYPDLDADVALTRVASLDLYRQPDPFRRPPGGEFRDWIDVVEYGLMCTAGFPEPLTFSMRVARLLKERVGEFDVVHDNQCLGYGLLEIARSGLPLIATVHHPVSIDRRLELQHADRWKRRVALRRWYGFTRMQARVARRLARLIAVSEAARDDAAREFRIERERIAVVHNGVDTETFRPRPAIPTVAGRIVTTASANVPLKGLVFLIEAVAKLRTERDVELLVIGKGGRGGAVRAALDRFGLEHVVRFESGVTTGQLAELYASAEVAVVPSLYEGFSLPAIEAMSCRVPLVATTAGALPEVAGPDAALLVRPGDPDALKAAVARVLDDKVLARRLGEAGRRRAVERFSWQRAADETMIEYEKLRDNRAHS